MESVEFFGKFSKQGYFHFFFCDFFPISFLSLFDCNYDLIVHSQKVFPYKFDCSFSEYFINEI